MFLTEEKIVKNIVTPNGEDEFELRYFRDDDVGLLTTRTGKAYLMLDSIDYWYDLIQERYPAKQKCKCKNDYFRFCFNYVPRVGTDDYRTVEVVSYCTECGKEKKISEIDIDYSPTYHLFEQPITYCKQPKIKYKTYSVDGYWKEEKLYDLVEFLIQKQLFIYCWYWKLDEHKRCVKEFTPEELKDFLFVEKENYLSIYFSAEELKECFNDCPMYDDGIYIDSNIWRRREMFMLNAPILVAVQGAGYYYSMNFCSEYIDKTGQVKAKGADFERLVQEFLAYSRE